LHWADYWTAMVHEEGVKVEEDTRYFERR
jgi:hypothetical protein